MIIFIDIGGTPASILKNNKYSIALANKIPKERIIAILDPFDLSRAERTFIWKDKKIKISINSKEFNLDSEKEIIENKNLRELMNERIKLKYPELRTIKLEEILSNNKNVVYEILNKIKIPIRAICPVCNKFKRVVLGNNEMCCNIKDNQIIENGKYIPQKGFLSVILYLCGYKTFSDDKEKEIEIENIRQILKFKGNPLVKYIKQNSIDNISNEVRK